MKKPYFNNRLKQWENTEDKCLERYYKEVTENRIITPEQFIEEYTNHCSNEIEQGIYHEWLTPEQALKAVELARKEMNDKACRYLQDHIDKDLVIYHNNTWRKRDEFIEMLKKYMEE